MSLARETGRVEGRAPTISVIIPVYNSADTLRRCLDSVVASTCRPYECIVVDDGSTDGSAEAARAFPVRIVTVPDGPSGPGRARNAGAAVAGGDVLFFVDADVVLHADAIAKVGESFAADPILDAVFGSYDDDPGTTDFLSRYKNLFHHFVHQQARRDAVTFWGACGAVRRQVFQALGGFDSVRYPRPSIEDIDFGYRLRGAGRRIALNKTIQVQHCKQWTLRGLVRTDIFDRGIPWTRLALRERCLPNDLNISFAQRVSAFLLCGVLAYLGLIALFYDALVLPLLVALFMLIVYNWSEDTPHFQMSRRAQILTCALIGAVAALALRSGQLRMLPFLGLLVFGLLADRLTAQSGARWTRIILGVTVLTLLLAVFIVLSHFSIRLGGPFLLFVFGIMAINYRLYGFFARKQGLVFMISAIPFHFLYYLYSIVAFVLGVGLYVLVDSRRRDDRHAMRWAPPAPDPGLAGTTHD